HGQFGCKGGPESTDPQHHFDPLEDALEIGARLDIPVRLLEQRLEVLALGIQERLEVKYVHGLPGAKRCIPPAELAAQSHALLKIRLEVLEELDPVDLGLELRDATLTFLFRDRSATHQGTEFFYSRVELLEYRLLLCGRR